MATKKDATTQTTSGMRRCIGSTTFGIEAHEAPVDDFPVQASAKDGLGRNLARHTSLGVVAQGNDRAGGTDDDM